MTNKKVGRPTEEQKKRVPVPVSRLSIIKILLALPKELFGKIRVVILEALK